MKDRADYSRRNSIRKLKIRVCERKCIIALSQCIQKGYQRSYSIKVTQSTNSRVWADKVCCLVQCSIIAFFPLSPFTRLESYFCLLSAYNHEKAIVTSFFRENLFIFSDRGEGMHQLPEIDYLSVIRTRFFWKKGVISED